MAAFTGVHPIIQALLATLFTWAMTALGAASVFLAREVNRKFLIAMQGFAVMMLLDVALG